MRRLRTSPVDQVAETLVVVVVAGAATVVAVGAATVVAVGVATVVAVAPA